MWFGFYRLGDKVIAPTTGGDGFGWFRAIEPVEVASIDEPATLKAILLRTLLRGNPLITMPEGPDRPPPVILAYTPYKRWSDFDRRSLEWGLSQEEDRWVLTPMRRRSRGAGREADEGGSVTLDDAVSLEEVAGRVAKLLSGG